MICFICKIAVNNLQALVVHFKIIHLLKPDSAYTCCEEFCSQSFICLSSFKRHMIKKHTVKSTNYELQNVQEYIFNEAVSNKNDCLGANSRDSTVSNSKDGYVEENVKTFNYLNSIKLLHEATVQFVLSLHNNSNFNSSDVTFIQSGIKEYILRPMASIFKNLVEEEIHEPALLFKILKFETVLLDPFFYCSTEHRLNNWLKNNNLLSPIHQFTINNTIVPVDHAGNIMYDEKITKGVLLPIKYQFKQFFECHDNYKIFYDKLIEYENDHTSISNFVQGKLWKEKKALHEGKIVFPYFLYIDEFEINNPLGSHAHVQSIAAVYYNFPLDVNNSKLTNIFLAALIKSYDVKKFGNEACFEILINELNELEKEGINISTQNGIFQVYFVLGLVLGDNLGLNSLFEFSKSFSANYYCRFCKVHKSVANELYDEDSTVMRTVQNYSDDVAKMCFSETGIYKESIMNSLYSFHVTMNFCADSMHDLFEGICHYDMCQIIK